MKSLIRIAATSAFALSTFFATAQVTQAKVSYKIEFDTDDPQMKMQLGMMGNSSMTMWFNGDLFRQEMDMGGFSKNTTIMNNAEKKGLLLLDVPMQGMKMAVPIDPTADKEEEPEMEVEEVIGEEVEVAGYKCKKYILTDQDGNEMTMYTTTELKKQEGGRFNNAKVSGFPLKIEFEQAMFKMVMTATNVEQKYKEKDKELYSLEIPEGYDEGTMEDLQGMGGM
jgi:hypothetical protein